MRRLHCASDACARARARARDSSAPVPTHRARARASRFAHLLKLVEERGANRGGVVRRAPPAVRLVRIAVRVREKGGGALLAEHADRTPECINDRGGQPRFDRRADHLELELGLHVRRAVRRAHRRAVHRAMRGASGVGRTRGGGSGDCRRIGGDEPERPASRAARRTRQKVRELLERSDDGCARAGRRADRCLLGRVGYREGQRFGERVEALAQRRQRPCDALRHRRARCAGDARALPLDRPTGPRETDFRMCLARRGPCACVHRPAAR